MRVDRQVADFRTGSADRKRVCIRLPDFYLRGTVTTLRKSTTMADPENKYPDNIEGKYYVDDQCIDCDLCRETAPQNFKRNEDGGYSFLFKQPENEEEQQQCAEAMEGCPVEAIGDDGS